MKKNDFKEVLLKLGFNDIVFDISDDDYLYGSCSIDKIDYVFKYYYILGHDNHNFWSLSFERLNKDDDFYGWSFPFHWDISKSDLESTITKNIREFQNRKINIKPVQLSIFDFI